LKAGLGLLLAAGVGIAAWLLLPQAPSAQSILLSDAVARPISDQLAVATLTIENSGGPDRLVSVTSTVADVSLYTPADPEGPPVHSGTASLALDSAHVRIAMTETLRDGSLIPVTLTFAMAGPVTTRVRLSDPATAGAAGDSGLFGLGDICVVGEGEPAPQIALRVAQTADGWQVMVDTKEFTFSEEYVGLFHVPGMGHGHLYVGGMKLDRMYAPTANIGALPPGTHEVRVTLNTNDHRAYVIDERPVTATAQIIVDAPNT